MVRDEGATISEKTAFTGDTGHWVRVWENRGQRERLHKKCERRKGRSGCRGSGDVAGGADPGGIDVSGIPYTGVGAPGYNGRVAHLEDNWTLAFLGS